MLPDLIEIVPPRRRRETTVVLPGSKSITNRALILAALATRSVMLRGALWSEDTQAMVECLERLGFPSRVEPDPAEPANRTITIEGRGGTIPNAGTPGHPLELFVENAGTAARFLPPMLCLGHGSYRVSGIARMHERPQAALIGALRQLGYRIDTPNDRLPAIVHGTGPRPGAACTVSVAESSQFASALLLSARIGSWQVAITGANEDELPYVDMTRRLIEEFPWGGGTYDIEADASGASYFWGADWLLRDDGSHVTVEPTPRSGMQADQKFLELVAQASWRPSYSRRTDLADSIMTAIVLAPFASTATQFTDLGRLRVQECERVKALHTELAKCGARVEESGDTLVIRPGALHGAEIETYNDHRVAMCFGMLGLRVPGMRLRRPACVRKTFPNFFAKLGELGAVIRDPASGAALSGDALLA
ncbi:MAG: 3-phosphoshikimate 1-carboxyvinyltransferase [Reyranella sp.]|uniref:3-phosphoshikimate 1-carboxyvinyltransferase n=1 Tax=Reyranella sp. TaxID=1929291 RepID=UPI003D0FE4AB